jgi:hypothetical protein
LKAAIALPGGLTYAKITIYAPERAVDNPEMLKNLKIIYADIQMFMRNVKKC